MKAAAPAALCTYLDDAIAATRRGELSAAIALVARVALALPSGDDRRRAVRALTLLHAQAGSEARSAALRATLDV